MSTPPGDVRAAFTILLDEINATVEAINQENMRAIAERNYDKVIQLTERARAMDQFRDRVNALQRDWQTIVQGVARPAPQPVRRRARRKRGDPMRDDAYQSRSTHLAKGLRTPEDAFRLPILHALVQLGGSGKMQAVLDLVHEEMAPQLNHHDYEATASTPDEPRWKNNARWCRANMIKDGLLRSDSPHGMWEISDEGRAWVVQAESATQPPPTPAATAPPPLSTSSSRSRGNVVRAPVGRAQGTHLARGLRTPEEAYRVPILRALVQLGGRGQLARVLELVHEQMAGQLNQYDHEGLPSLPKVPRWKNGAQWCRAKLIDEGLLRGNSDHGFWEISDAGRAWLTARNAAPPTPPPTVRHVSSAAPVQPNDDAAEGFFDDEESNGGPTQVTDADWAVIEKGLEPLPKLLENVLMVFRTMHRRGYTYASAARAVADRRGLATVNTIYDACTRRLGLTAAQFRVLVDSPTRLHEHLTRYYPAFDTQLYELLIDAF